MRIPREILIQGQLWKIFFRKNLKYKGKIVDGLADFEKREIFIRKGLPKALKIHTFLHEFNHAAIYELKIILGRRLEEKLVDGLGLIYENTFDFKMKKK